MGTITNKEFFKRIEARDDFKVLFEPVGPKTRLVPSEYVIRDDGTFIFLEAVFTDPDGSEHIIGNPVRFPKMPGNTFQFPGKIDKIFGQEIFNIMKIFAGNKMGDSHSIQVETLKATIASQAGTGWALRPFRPTPLHVGSRFDRSEFIYHFPMDKTLKYFIDQKVPNVLDALVWAEREVGLKVPDLGLTGSSSLGIIDPKEDVDLCFIAPVAKLTAVRNVIRDGVKSGRFTPLVEFGHVWPLRVKTDTFELCPFFVGTDYEMNGACITLNEKLPDQKVRIVGDERNMLSPIMLQVEDEKKKVHELVITTGFNRGHYFTGDRLLLKGPETATVKTSARTFEALVIKSWNSADIIK